MMRKFNVLLTDDEELALNGIEEGVDWESIHVDKVYKCHGKDTAVRMLKTYKIDMLVTDIEMPNGSGLELLRWVRENKADMPVVFYTGYAEFSYVQEALRLGAMDYLLKPVPYRQLEQILLKMEDKILHLEKSAELAERMEDMTAADDGNVVNEVKNLIAENLSRDIQRDELAAMVHISAGHLTRIFKKQEGISLSDYIIRKRIAVAKQLLSKTALPVSTVASRVGISHSSYFTKVFKEHVGMTPQEYRHNCKNI